MSGLTIAVIVIAGAVAGFVLLGLLIKVITSATAKAGAAKIAQRFPDRSVVLKEDPMANSLGQTSKGVAQLRGNGGLVLTADALHFFGIGRDDLVIPLRDITSVETTKSHLGKSIFRPLLKVNFADDSIAFYVADLVGWTNAIEQQRARATGG